MNITQIKETCIYFEDLELAKHFYHELLELPIIRYEPEKFIFFRAGASVLLCFNPNFSKPQIKPPGHYSSGKYHFAFEVTNEEYERHKQFITSKGILIIQKMIWETGQESFYFEDPIGNVLEIVPQGIWDK